MTLSIGTTALLIIIIFFWFLMKWLFRVLFILLIYRAIGTAIEKGKEKLLGGSKDDGSPKV